MLTEWLLVGLGLVLTAATGVFVAAEFALVTLDRPAVERAAQSGDRRAVSVLAGLRSLSTQLSGAQVGITVTTLLVGYLVEPSVSALLVGPLSAAGLSEAAAPGVSVVLGLALATGVSMLFGELVPKNLALSRPLATARLVVGPQRAFTAATTPLIRALNALANRILRRVGVEPVEELPSGRRPEEIASLVRRSAQVGTLDEQAADLLTRTIDFSALTAADVMTPRVRMDVVREGQSCADVVRLSRRTGHSRFPLIGESADDVLGVVHLKACLIVPRAEREGVAATEVMSPAVTVPETLRLDPLLILLRSRGLQVALVADEYGGTAGMVTLEDVVEELVGEVVDEHDRTRPGVVHRADGSFGVPGLLRPDEVSAATGFAIPDSPTYETVAGFVVSRLGRLAEAGDRVDVAGAEIVVEGLAGRRVDRLRLVPRHAGEGNGHGNA